jgi:uncharacterized protein with GYD domain
MAKYAVLWKFTEGAVRSMVAGGHPSPHTTRTLIESVGGNLEVYYWIAGSSHDGIAIVDVPDSSSATALKLAFRNASVVEYIESYELVATEDIPELLGRVGGMEFPP